MSLYGGATNLHKAAACGVMKAAELLIKHKEDVNYLDQFDRTPLHNAALCGELEMVKLLVDSGAWISPEDKNGDTPADLTSIGLVCIAYCDNAEWNGSFAEILDTCLSQ